MPGRTYWCSIIVALVVLVSADAFAFDKQQIVSGLERYEADVDRIAIDMGDIGAYKSSFVFYLQNSRGEARTLRNHLAREENGLEALKGLKTFGSRRVTRKDEVMSEVGPKSNEWPLLLREDRSWKDNVMPFLEAQYVRDLVVRKKLFELKYFEEDDPKQANLFEGWLNGTLPFTKYDEKSAVWYRQEGVSKWEATVRVEPVVLVKDETHAGVLFTGGMLYNFFPEVRQSATNPYESDITDNWLSEWVKRTGVKIGAGAAFDDPRTEFLSGLGIQIRAWSVWGTYSFGHSRFSAAVSLSDWDWLKNYLPIFK